MVTYEIHYANCEGASCYTEIEAHNQEEAETLLREAADETILIYSIYPLPST